jgi:hypothetical protein
MVRNQFTTMEEGNSIAKIPVVSKVEFDQIIRSEHFHEHRMGKDQFHIIKQIYMA